MPETLAQVISCRFCEISKSTFSYRTPPVATSDYNNNKFKNYALDNVTAWYKK